MSGRAVAVYLLSMGVLIAVEWLSFGWRVLLGALGVVIAVGYVGGSLVGGLLLAVAVERRARARRAER